MLGRLYIPRKKKNDISRGPGIGCIAWFLIIILLMIATAILH